MRKNVPQEVRETCGENVRRNHGAILYEAGIPRHAVGTSLEDLIPISEAAGAFLQKRFGEESQNPMNVYIGLDTAVTTGHPAVIATELILVPIMLLPTVILPGNNVLPFGDLAAIPFIVAMIVAAARENIVHSVLAGTIVIGMSLYMATAVAEAMTNMAIIGKFNIPEGAAMISAIDQGKNLINFIICEIFNIFM